MKKLKTKKRLLVVVCILLPISLFFTFHLVTAIQNPFDEMLYSVPKYVERGAFSAGFSLPDFPYTKTNFGNKFTFVTQIPGSRWIAYRPPYLKPNEVLLLSAGRGWGNKKTMHISFTVYLDDETNHSYADSLHIAIAYNASNKTLTYDEIYVMSTEFSDSEFSRSSHNKEDILYLMDKYNLSKKTIEEWQHYILYEKLLPDWFETNQGKSKFSMDNLGEFTIINNTFSAIDEK